MKDFFDGLIITLLMFGLLALEVAIALWIGELDLPFWVKLWLLSK